MPIFRRTDGNMTQKPTGAPLDDTDGDCIENEPPRLAPEATPKGKAAGEGREEVNEDRYTSRTQMPGMSGRAAGFGSPGGRGSGAEHGDADDGTQFVGGAGAEDPSAEGHRPVVGWLVVTDGPGAGRDIRLLAGRNEIGRSAEAGTPVPFGDRYMSRRQQLWISYDHRANRFSIAPGTSGNVSYVDDEPVEGPKPLNDGATVRVGKTTLKFAAFCGARCGEPLHQWEEDAALPDDGPDPA